MGEAHGVSAPAFCLSISHFQYGHFTSHAGLHHHTAGYVWKASLQNSVMSFYPLLSFMGNCFCSMNMKTKKQEHMEMCEKSRIQTTS